MDAHPVGIFLRTFAKDLPWLVMFLRSYKKYARGFEELIVHCDQCDFAKVTAVCRGYDVTIVVSHVHSPNGYINQQIVKLHADLWMSTPFILYCDSDYIFTRPSSPAEFLTDGKPTIVMTSYAELGSQVPWQANVQILAKCPVAYEYMRMPRLIYRTDLLRKLREFLRVQHQTNDVPALLANQPALSEFNLMGWFAHAHDADNYIFVDTAVGPVPSTPFRQFWSWGGVTDDVRKEYEAAMKGVPV